MSTITETVPRCISGEGANASERVKAAWTGAVLAQRNAGADWYYPNPSPAARKIEDHVAFWRGVKVQRLPGRAVDVTGRSR